MRSLVTGAGGFIGSHLVEQLVAQGSRVRALVRYTSRTETDAGWLRTLPEETLASVEIIRGDLRDSSAILQAMDGCETVFHLGAVISIPYSYVHPREVIETNLLGTLNVLEAARKTQPKRLVHASSSEVYGTAQQTPMNERHPLRAQSPYSASKIGADKLVESFHRSFGVPAVTVRPFNTYGPRQSARAVIPTIIVQALTGERIRLGSLHPRRDFAFVEDTARAFVLAAGAAGAVGREIHLGTGQEITIGDLAEKILRLTGRRVPIISEDERVRPSMSEVERLVADNALAKSVLGWEPKVSLDEGLDRTIAWFQEHLGLYEAAGYNV